MNKIAQKVYHILNTEGSLSNEFGELSKIYLMTTENIKGFLKDYCLEDKDILTVASSGDQMLNAYLMGAKNVTCFDINPLAFYQVKLKKAAICTLKYEEFLEFFFPRLVTTSHNHFLGYQLFRKIIPMLDQETAEFWTYLYDHSSHVTDFYHRIYYRFQPTLEKMQKMNSYLDKENYQKLASILPQKEISFIQSDITSLHKNLDHSYDMMLFSNISDKIEKIWSHDELKKFKRLIHSLSKRLNKNGVIQVGYIYDYYFSNSTALFRQHSQRQAVFIPTEFHTTFVESYRFNSESDAIITFQKKR
ncbi:MAG: DUF3419 family protein [bacterium]|nr:DUF3419 family protein [bacterium]